jgi:hypothetical protein
MNKKQNIYIYIDLILGKLVEIDLNHRIIFRFLRL